MATQQSSKPSIRAMFVGKRHERFWSRVEKHGDACWRWRGARHHRGGHGCFKVGGFNYIAHRVAYELVKGPIPDGLMLDHLCRNRACVNPDHLEAVSNRDNQMRGFTLSSKNALKTSCVHGHPFSPENTRIVYRRSHRERVCLACRRRTAKGAADGE